MPNPDYQVEIVTGGALPDYRVADVSDTATPRPDFYMVANVAPRLPDFRVAVVAESAGPDFRIWGLAVGNPPVFSVAPAISGTPTQGQTLTATTGTASNSPTYTGQWRADGANIAGATATTYVLTGAEVGKVITYVSTATNGDGSATSTSNSLGPVAAAPVPVNSVAPVASGTATQGQTLSTTNGTWSNSPTGYTYQWRRGGVAISGATAQTYLLQAADVGATITSAVVASNANGAGAAAVSNGIGPIAAAPASTTWSTTDKTAGIVLSNANLTAASSGSAERVRGTTGKTDKRHIEFTMGSSVPAFFGLSDGTTVIGSLTGAANPGVTVGSSGNIFVDGNVTAFGSSPAANEVWAFEIDGTSVRIITPSASYGPYTTTASFPFAYMDNGQSITMNVGGTAFARTVTSGFTAWG